MSFKYPEIRRDESVKDVYHGVEVNNASATKLFSLKYIILQVSDPYRWLEDPDSEETKEFVKNQNNITRPYLDDCIYKNQIKKTLTQVWDYPKCSHPARYELVFILFNVNHVRLKTFKK